MADQTHKKLLKSKKAWILLKFGNKCIRVIMMDTSTGPGCLVLTSDRQIRISKVGNNYVRLSNLFGKRSLTLYQDIS